MRQLVDDEVAITPAARDCFRLPLEFELHTSCRSCNISILGLGICDNGLWTYTALVDPIEAPGLPPGWMTLGERGRTRLLEELAREIFSGHVLHGLRILPLARRTGSDEVLVRSVDNNVTRLHVVRLTWGRHGDPSLPRTQSVASLADLADL